MNPDDIEEGDDVYFECKVHANPGAYKVVWKHNVSQNCRVYEIRSMMYEVWSMKYKSFLLWIRPFSCVYVVKNFKHGNVKKPIHRNFVRDGILGKNALVELGKSLGLSLNNDLWILSRVIYLRLNSSQNCVGSEQWLLQP